MVFSGFFAFSRCHACVPFHVRLALMLFSFLASRLVPFFMPLAFRARLAFFLSPFPCKMQRVAVSGMIGRLNICFSAFSACRAFFFNHFSG